MANDRLRAEPQLGGAAKLDPSMLRHVLDQARDCIKILAPEGQVEYINSEGRCALAISDFGSVCGKLWPELWPETSRPAIESALEKARLGEGSEVEASRPDPRGESRWWRISVSPLRENAQKIAGILTISRDVTSHVRLRESERTLAHEMRHRLRNAYTVASAIVAQSAREDPPVQRFAERVCGRLADIAVTQGRLLEAGDKSWTLAELARTLIGTHLEAPSLISFAGEADAILDGPEAMLVALVIGELTTNSLKHGALRNREGATLSWTDQAGHLTVDWCEPYNSVHATLEARDAGSGYSLMMRMAQNQQATFRHEVVHGELRVTLTLNNRDTPIG